MTEARIARLTVEVDRLRNEAERLDKGANNQERMYDVAWAEYGSELAGQPASITVDRNMAMICRKIADFLESAKRGEVSLDEMVQIDDRICQIDQELKKLNKEKGDLYCRKASLLDLAKIIGD